jgi:Flp pilus assembly pilin Flp
MSGFLQKWQAFWVLKLRSRRGQTLVEYGLIITLVAIVAIGVLIVLGNRTTSLYSSINSQFARASGS